MSASTIASRSTSLEVFLRGSREISLAPSLHRASTDALIMLILKKLLLLIQSLL